MRTYERDLPEGFCEIRTISPSNDRKDSMIGMVCVFAPSLLLLIIGFQFVKVAVVQYLTLFLLIPLIPVYLMLHELLHGIVYFVLTGQKFKIGRNKDGFYCVLPQLYVYLKTQVLCAAAPLLVLAIALLWGSVIAIRNQSGLFIVLSCMLAFHFFACRSDVFLMKELLKTKGAGKLLIREKKNGDNIVFGRK